MSNESSKSESPKQEIPGVNKGTLFMPLLLLGVIVVIFGGREIERPDILVEITKYFPDLQKAQLDTLGLLLLYSLVPGIIGSIYRRAFWKWFLLAFLILFTINWLFLVPVADATPTPTKPWTRPLFLFIELQCILLLLAFRLRPHSDFFQDADHQSGMTKFIGIVAGLIHALLTVLIRKWARWLTAFLLGLAIVGSVWLLSSWAWGDPKTWVPTVTWALKFDGNLAEWLVLQGVLIVLVLAFSMFGLRQLADHSDENLESDPRFARFSRYVKAVTDDKHPDRKNIVVCFDGTGNEPGTTDLGSPAETNVYKLFKMLKGAPPLAHNNASLCKVYRDDDKTFAKQIAFYYNGVGTKAENSQLIFLMGGAFGLGASGIVERAYLDVAREYRHGDRVFIFGFSRGAAIARLFAGVLGRRGSPKSLWTLRLFGRHWMVWQSKQIEAVKVAVLGCWDTVGAFRISKNILGIPFQKINLLKDFTVSLCVKRAYHMVALDETRDAFEPTLMDPDPTAPDRITEVWFSGNHSNIGGYYATDKLSNVTLDFLLRRVSSGYAGGDGMKPGDESWGLYLSAKKRPDTHDPSGQDANLDPMGTLRQETGPMYSYAPRTLPLHAVTHDSVFVRLQHAEPVYAPQSLFNLNMEVLEKRKVIKTAVDGLKETNPQENWNALQECSKKLALRKKCSTLPQSDYKTLAGELDNFPTNKIPFLLAELIQIAKNIVVSPKEIKGLDEREKAFYKELAEAVPYDQFFYSKLDHQAIETNREIRRHLLPIADKLRTTIKGDTSTDWKQLDTARTRLRELVKEIVTKLGYPPSTGNYDKEQVKELNGILHEAIGRQRKRVDKTNPPPKVLVLPPSVLDSPSVDSVAKP